MAWDKGFNFRATADYVTDGPDETYVLGDIYPTTRNGVTFGWVTSAPDETRDRSTTVDVRLAGQNAIDNTGASQNFRVDLTATGDYTIRLAAGDASFAQKIDVEFLDDTTVFSTVADNVATAGGQFVDATGVTRTTAAWPADNQTLARTFASTLFVVRCAALSATVNNSVLAHLFVSQAAAGAAWGPLLGLENNRLVVA